MSHRQQSDADSEPARYLEDFTPGTIIDTPPHTVTEAEIIDFAKRYDPQYYHTDPHAACRSIFAGLVAGGFQTAALVWALALRTGWFEHCAMAGIGVDELRWLAPLRPGDAVRCRITVIDNRVSRSKPDRGVIVGRYDLFNQHRERILTLTMTQMLRRRPRRD